MTMTQAEPQQDPSSIDMNRRDFTKTLALALGATAVAPQAMRQTGIIQPAQAAPPIVWIGLGIGGTLAVDYFVGAAGDGTDPEEIVTNQVIAEINGLAYERMDGIRGTMRGIINESDTANRNGQQAGMWAAREAWSNQLPKADVKDAAFTAAAEEVSKPMRDIVNGIMSYNNTVARIKQWEDDLDDAGINPSDHLNDSGRVGYSFTLDDSYTVTLPDGEEIPSYKFTGSRWDPPGELALDLYKNADHGNVPGVGWQKEAENGYPDDFIIGGYGDLEESHPAYYYLAWQALESEWNTVQSSLDTWIDNIHEDIASGELAIPDTITPSDMESIMVENGVDPSAARLLALGYPVSDLDGVVTLETDIGGMTWTLPGLLGVHDGPEDLHVDTEYDPDDMGGVYHTVDWHNSSAVLDPSNYEMLIDGGILTMTTNPASEERQGLEYQIRTVNDEAALVDADPETWTEDTENGVWTTDVSDQLQQTIADIVEVMVYVAEGGEGDYRHSAMRVDDGFTIMDATDGSGQSQSTVRTSPITDRWTVDDYQTAEDFEQEGQDRRDRMDDIRDAIGEDDTIIGNITDAGRSLTDFFGSTRNVIIAAVVAIVGFVFLNSASS